MIDKKLFSRLKASLGQADEIIKSKRAPSRGFHADALAVKKIRASTRLSQNGFAELIKVYVGTLRNWEQGRREPTGPARALLRAIRNNAASVIKALA